MRPRSISNFVSQAEVDNAMEVGIGQWANCRLSSAGNLAGIVQHAPFNNAERAVEGHRFGEIEIRVLLD